MAPNPDDYTLAIVCAMEHEFDPVYSLFKDPPKSWSEKPNDHNIYFVGRFVDHRVVPVMPGDKGELDTGLCTQRLREAFPKIELTFLVGICAAVPDNAATKQAIYLGDVIVGTKVWRAFQNTRIIDLGADEGI